LRIAALVFIFSIAVLGLNLLMGFAGQVSLGHAGFFGIGAYAVAIGPTHLGVPSWVALIAGVVLAGLLAFVVGRPILRLKGHYLAGGDARHGSSHRHGLHQRSALDWRAGRHAGCRDCSFSTGTARGSITWYWISASRS
jgi:branched-chain amino acid transport system permease protein